MADGSNQPIRCDLDAEAAVLSAALLDDGAALELVDCVSSGDFWSDANRRIFEEIAKLVCQSAAVDVRTVAASLRSQDRLDQIGGTAYLAQLADATPSISHLRDHAKILRDLARLRRALDTFRRLAAEAPSVVLSEIDEWMQSCETRAYKATAERDNVEETASTYRELAAATYVSIETAFEARKNNEEPRVGYFTGFSCLDENLGGFQPGQLIVVAARPGNGKSSLMLQLAEAIAKSRRAVIILSLEMPRRQLMARSYGRLAGIPSRELLEGFPGRMENVEPARDELIVLPVAVDDEAYITPVRARAKVRRHYARIRSDFPGIELGAIFVDYLQLMNPDRDEARRSENRAVELGRITRELKIMARDLGVPVIALSQLRRPDNGKGRPQPPTMEELRDSGRIEEDADVILFIHRADRESSDAELIIAKAREADTGSHAVKWNGRRTSFYEQKQGSFA